MRGFARRAIQQILLWAICALPLAGFIGCATNKKKEGPAADAERGQAAFTNRFASSVSAEAEETARASAAPARAADNTAQNRRDAGSDTLTPLDQGNSATDLRITQTLRRAVMRGSGGRSFSFLAKNVKIITINGEVTLRGVVKTQLEKEAIQTLAEKTGGVKKINNQLEVKQ